MVHTRFDSRWPKRGFNLLWDATALADLIDPALVMSLRQFFALSEDWPDDLPAANGDALVVAGFEGCVDILDAKDAEHWIENDLKDAILSFQDYYQGQAGLIFWLPSGRNRISMKGASEEYFWKHRSSGPSGLHIGRLLWSGAESEVERILDTDDQRADFDGRHWIGLHHPRIS